MQCYKATGDLDKYIRTCAQLASSCELSLQERCSYYTLLHDALAEDVGVDDGAVLIPCDRIFSVSDVQLISRECVILDSDVSIRMNVCSKLPVPVTFRSVSASLQALKEAPTRHEVERKGSSVMPSAKALGVHRSASSVEPEMKAADAGVWRLSLCRSCHYVLLL